MKNTTVYTHELLLKFNLAYVARWKKNTRIYTILTAIAGIILVAADILVEQYHTAYGGWFAFLLCMTGFFSLLKSSKAKLYEKVAKELQVSLCKVTRGAKILKDEKSVLARLIKENK